jgi:acyl dehydratase
VPVNASVEGRVYPPTEPYLVGREKVREFARAVFATHPVNLDPEAARAAGYADVVAPTTFPIVVTAATLEQLLADDEAGVDFTRVVHGDQRFAYSRPVVAGDELVCVNSVDEITSRGGHDFLTTRTEVTTEAGEPVVTVWSKLVQRGEN